MDAARQNSIAPGAGPALALLLAINLFNYIDRSILAAVERDRVFYRRSGGGVTFSGGEATGQPELSAADVADLLDTLAAADRGSDPRRSARGRLGACRGDRGPGRPPPG